MGINSIFTEELRSRQNRDLRIDIKKRLLGI